MSDIENDIKILKAVPNQNAIAITMDTLKDEAEDVMTGKRDALICFGGSGLGKNHVIDATLAKYGPKDSDGLPERVSIDSPDTYKAILDGFHRATHWRKKPWPIVMDEAHLIFQNPRNLNILKMATDEIGKKEIEDYAWYTEDIGPLGGVKKIKHLGVSLKAPIFIMTNTNLHDMPKENRNHANALFSRIQPILIPDDKLEAWQYAVWLAMEKNVINTAAGKTVSLTDRSRALAWFTANIWNMDQVSIRTLKAITKEMVLARSPEKLAAKLDALLLPVSQRSDARPVPKQSAEDFRAIKLAW
jgi:hypothetical protein